MGILHTIMKSIFHREEPAKPAPADTRTHVTYNGKTLVYDCPKHKNGSRTLHPFALKLYYAKYPGIWDTPEDFSEEEKAWFDEHREGNELWGNEVERADHIKWAEESNRETLAFGPILARYHDGNRFHECPMCLLAQHRQALKDSLIKKATAAHGGKFDYSKVGEVTSINDKVTVICPEHGEHQIEFSKHANVTVSCMCNEKLPDTVYLWKLLGSDKMYKVGVTRGRLGTNRIQQVEKSSGHKAKILAMKTISGSAYVLEQELKGIGQKAFPFKSFDGATEVRIMNGNELSRALKLIESTP